MSFTRTKLNVIPNSVENILSPSLALQLQHGVQPQLACSALSPTLLYNLGTASTGFYENFAAFRPCQPDYLASVVFLVGLPT